MSERLPRLTARGGSGAGTGGVRAGQRGSHRIYRDTRGRRVTVPFNPTEALHPNLLRQVLKDSGLTVADIKEER